MESENAILISHLNNAVLTNQLLQKCLRLYLNIMQLQRRKRKRILKLLLNRQNHLRIQNPINSIINLYVDSDFHAHFRMTRDTFYKLVAICNKESNLEVKYHGGYQPLSVEKKVSTLKIVLLVILINSVYN